MTTNAIIDLIIRLLRALGLIKPDTPTPPLPEDPAPEPQRITKDDNFRTLPTITKERMREITKGYPLEGESDAIHAALKGRPLALAQSWMESSYGGSENARKTKNALGLMDYTGTYPAEWINGTLPLRKFSTWAEGFAEWSRRMDDPNYAGGVYPQGATLEQFIRIYVAGPGPGYANGESAGSVENYLTQTVNRLNRYYGFTDPPTTTPPPSRVGTPYSVAGTSKQVILPFPLKQAIIPDWQKNQRPGYAMTPDRYVQHDTANRNTGANALMHKNYLHNGAEGQQLSYHFTVDDKEAWQMIPVNEVAWHGGDNDGPCNMRGISCELCINADINEPRSRENAEILAAEVMNALGIESLKKHQDCSGKHCPGDMLGDGYWPTFVQRVTALRESRK